MMGSGNRESHLARTSAPRRKASSSYEQERNSCLQPASNALLIIHSQADLFSEPAHSYNALLTPNNAALVPSWIFHCQAAG